MWAHHRAAAHSIDAPTVLAPFATRYPNGIVVVPVVGTPAPRALWKGLQTVLPARWNGPMARDRLPNYLRERVFSC